jgi:hypothetical protein
MRDKLCINILGPMVSLSFSAFVYYTHSPSIVFLPFLWVKHIARALVTWECGRRMDVLV